MRSADVMWEWPCSETMVVESAPALCVFGARRWDEAGEKAILWGDSNAQHLAPLLSAAAVRENVAVALYDRCYANVDGESVVGDYPAAWNDSCKHHKQDLYRLIERDPEIRTVIIAGSWVYAMNQLLGRGERVAITNKAELFELSLGDMVGRLLGLGRRVVLVSTTPQYPRDPTSCNLKDVGLLRRQCDDRERFLSRAAATSFAAEALDVFKRVIAKYPEAKLVIPTDGLCATERCITTINGESLYRDGVHFRRNLRDDTKRELARLIGIDRVFVK
jgi:hypothetical protein